MLILLNIFLILVLNQELKFINTLSQSFIENENVSKGTSFITDNNLTLVPAVKERFGYVVYPHPIKSQLFEIKFKLNYDVKNRNYSMFLLGLVETNSFNAAEHNYSMFEKNFFAAKGIGIRINLDLDTAYVDELSSVQKHYDNPCKFTKQIENNIKITFSNSTLHLVINDTACPAYSGQLQEYEVMIKAANRVDGIAFVQMSDFSFFNKDPSLSREIESYHIKKQIEMSTKTEDANEEYSIYNESNPLDTVYYKLIPYKAKFTNLKRIEYYTDPVSKQLTYLSFIDEFNKKFTCPDYYTTKAKNFEVAYIGADTAIEEIQFKVTNAKNTAETITLGKASCTKCKTKKININQLSNSITGVKMYCNASSTLNLQFKYVSTLRNKSSDLIHNYLHKINKAFIESSVSLSKEYKRKTASYTTDQQHEYMMAQNQIIDETAYINNHYVSNQYASLNAMSHDLHSIKNYLFNLQKHHHSEMFSNSDVLNLNDKDLEKIYDENFGGYEEFQTFLQTIIEEKYKNVYKNLSGLQAQTKEKLVQLDKIQKFLDNYEQMQQEVSSEQISYVEIILVLLLVSSNLFLIYSYRLKERNLF